MKMELIGRAGAAFILASTVAAHAEEPLLADMFQSHAVLQRDRPIEVWGNAKPGSRIVASLAGKTVTARADADGRWRADFPALAAGGPYALAARADDGRAERVTDVLIGDVWLCSGQSNMVLPVRRTLNVDTEISNATDSDIRMMTIPTRTSLKPLRRFLAPVRWTPASPDTVADFSAACYYFARELKKRIDVPMGLVVAAWGGSRIETWMSDKSLQAAGFDDERLGLARLASTDPAAAARRWGSLWEQWWKKQAPAGDEPWRADTNDEDWRIVPKVERWDHWGEPDFSPYTGLAWYRTHVTLTEDQARKDAKLVLGAVDEIDQTWVNGVAVGGGSGDMRVYDLPRGVLHAGDNEVVVNITNTWGPGGLVGPSAVQAIRFADGSSAPLKAPWRIKKAPSSYGYPPRPPWEPLGGLGVAYNAMIAPIAPYGFRGALWYQGESNTEDAAHYKTYLTELMADWRSLFGADLPFLVVQLPGFGPVPTDAPQESGWAALREAQRAAAVEDAHAGLAVTIDIGDRYDIHPPNKQEVGRRLARVARHIVYGEPVYPSGPVPLSAKLTKKNIIVDFGDIDKGLVALGAEKPIGFELCSAGGVCRYAEARLNGSHVALARGKGEKPARVRYCWADDPICTLYDSSGLPAGPFDIEVR